MSENDALRIVAYLDGHETDITEGVRVLYDNVVGSLNWGSGFLSIEDMEQTVEVCRVCGFENLEEVQTFTNQSKQAAEADAFCCRTWPEVIKSELWRLDSDPTIAGVPHEHVYSSLGRCMWPRCEDRFEGSA